MRAIRRASRCVPDCYLAIGAVALQRPDFKYAAGRFHEDALWLLGPPGHVAFGDLATTPPRDTTVTLRASGYFVARSDWSDRADYLCFDAGEQAAGMRSDAVPNSMHGHADCLSVVLALDGRRVLADSGLFAYNCGGAWEAHFRETAAHNTARVDRRDQALHLGKMAWSHSYHARIEGSGGEAGWAVASHDGYARGPGGVTHRRAVWLRPDHYLLVWDEFAGAGDHDLEVNYQFAPGTLELLGPRQARLAGTADMAWASPLEWEASLHIGGSSPDEGWICPSLGVRIEAPRLRLRARFAGSRTVLVAVVAAARAGLSRLTAFEHGPIRVDCGSQADWVAADRNAGRSMDGYPAICRLDPDGQRARARDPSRPSVPHRRIGSRRTGKRPGRREGQAMIAARRARVLEVTSYPPPRAGWGIRVEYLKKRLEQDGHECVVLNTGTSRRIPSTEYETVMSGRDLARKVWRHARRGYVVHAHANGDAWKGLLLAIITEVLALAGGRRPILTFHAGAIQRYFPRDRAPWLAPLFWLAFLIPSRIICNNQAVRDRIAQYGVPVKKIVVIPAFTREYLGTRKCPRLRSSRPSFSDSPMCSSPISACGRSSSR